MKIITIFHLKIMFFKAAKNCSILYRRVFVMGKSSRFIWFKLVLKEREEATLNSWANLFYGIIKENSLLVLFVGGFTSRLTIF